MKVTAVDDAGIALTLDPGAPGRPPTDTVLDVCFDGRRIWSFWVLRDTRLDPTDTQVRRIDWPRSMHRFLDGTTRLSIVEHLSGTVVHDDDQRFGSGTDPIAVVNKDGKPLGIDKSGRMAQTFDTRSPEQVAPLLDSIETVIAALAEAGVEAFPAYGTLLGAVREGRLIGHDSDADLGYVSHHTAPVDVARESFAIQRRLAQQGYTTGRYSGAAFRVDVREADGSRRGLDVFGGFFSVSSGEERLYLMGEVGHPFRREWVFPLGTTTLEGRTLPAPAEPEHLLEAMYGPGWKVPDPAFKFETPAGTTRRLDGWFRGTRVHRSEWDRRYSLVREELPEVTPWSLSRYVVEREGIPAELVDLGAGRATQGLWFARQGSRVRCLDFVPSAALAVRRVVATERLPLEIGFLNLLELRSVLSTGAALAHSPGPRTLMARNLVECTNAFGRRQLWRLASMALREGGSIYLDFWAHGGEPPAYSAAPVPAAVVTRELEAAGARVVAQHELPPGEGGRVTARVVATWHESQER